MIIFESVTKQFGENPPAVEGVTFSVDTGEFIFLTGHSGSGKTTILKLLTKEYTLSDGEIEFEGEPLSKLKNNKLHKHRRKIGVIYQDYRLLPELNVWENIALALEIVGKPQREIEERVTDLLDLVQLSDKAYFFPAELSGGESQRVGIARALATAPNVLLADEPTGNLDPENTLMIARLFDKIHQLGTTVLFATHDLTVLETLGHRRLKMEKGRLIEDLPAKEGARKPATKKATSAPEATTAPASTQTVKEEPKKVIKHTKEETQKDVVVEKSHDTTEPKISSKEKDEKPPKKKGGFPGIHFSLFKKKGADKKSEKESEKVVSEKSEEPELLIEKKAMKSSPKVDIMIEEL